MSRLRRFSKQSILGGLLVVAPIIILMIIFRWAFESIHQLIAPLTGRLNELVSLPALAADLIVLALLVLLCFLVGTAISTSFGRWLHDKLDQNLSRLAPGYRMVRDVLQQFLGDPSKSPFGKGEVALVQLYGPGVPTLATGIVTSHHENGWLSVFVPTGPNPTSGFVYHLPPELVQLRPDIKLDAAFKTVLACGAGTGELLAKGELPESMDDDKNNGSDKES